MMEDYMPAWVIKDMLARSARPGRDLGESARVPQAKVDEWVQTIRGMGIKSIICLLDQAAFQYYPDLPGGLLDYYRQQGFVAVHMPVKDPANDPQGMQELEKNLAEIWKTFQGLPKPVLVHCSAGINRTGCVVDYICRQLNEGQAQGEQ